MNRSVFLRASVALLAGFVLASGPVYAAPPSKGKTDKATSRITGSKDYVGILGVKAPVASTFGFSGLIVVDTGLEIPDAKERRRAEGQMPRLRDAMRRATHGYINGIYEHGTVPDLDLLSRRLQRTVDQVLGPGIAEVTISSAIIHPDR